MAAMLAHQGPVCVPVIVGEGQALRFREWTHGCEMVAGEFGALIPAEGAWIEPEVLIVPLVGFDARGFRLGYGGGFYDRSLEGLRARRATVAVGFGFAVQELDEVPIDAFDQRLDFCRYTHQNHTVCNHGQRERADDRTVDAANAACHGCSAQNNGGNTIHFEIFAG